MLDILNSEQLTELRNLVRDDAIDTHSVIDLLLDKGIFTEAEFEAKRSSIRKIFDRAVAMRICELEEKSTAELAKALKKADDGQIFPLVDGIPQCITLDAREVERRFNLPPGSLNLTVDPHPEHTGGN